MAVIPYGALDAAKAGTATTAVIPALLLMPAIPYGLVRQVRES